jgi:hypothetical protein
VPHPFTAQGFDGDLRSVHLPPFPGPLWEGGHSSPAPLSEGSHSSPAPLSEGGHSSPAPLSEGSHSPPVPLSEAGHTLRRGYPSMTLTVLSCV